MKVFVKAKPSSKKEFVEKIDENHFAIAVSKPPVKGLANKAIVEALANYFDVSPSKVLLINGFSSKEKVFEVLQ